MIPYRIAEIENLLRLPSVNELMRRRYKINSTEFDVPGFACFSRDAATLYIDRNLPESIFAEPDMSIPPKPFLVLRAHITKALLDAIEQPDRAEQMRVLTYIRMTDSRDNPVEHAHSAGVACELHVLRLQYAESGVIRYQSAFTDRRTMWPRVPRDLERYHLDRSPP